MAVPESDVTVGQRIRELRVRRGLLQEQLAAPEFSASYLSRVESGVRPATGQFLAHVADRLRTTVEFLRSGVDPDAAEAVELKLRYAELALRSGDPQAARAQFEELAVRTEAEPVDPAVRRRIVVGGAQAAEACGDLGVALGGFRGVLEAGGVGEQSWIDAALGLIRCSRQVGDLGVATEEGERAVALLRARPDWPTPDAVRVLATLESAYQVRGDLWRAGELAREAVEIADALEDPRAQASAWWNSSMLSAEMGQIGDAVTLAERALATLSELDAERDTLRLRVALAGLLTLDGRAEEALAVLEAARLRVADMNVATDSAYWFHEMARANLALGQYDAAREHAERALDLLGTEPRLYAADVLITLGRITDAQGTDGGDRYLRQAAQHLAAVGSGRMAAQTWTALADVLDARGDTTGARDAYRAAALCLGGTPMITPRTVPDAADARTAGREDASR